MSTGAKEQLNLIYHGIAPRHHQELLDEVSQWLGEMGGQDLLDLINDLADTSRCHYDHHGHCQEHAWYSEGECPHARAQKLFPPAISSYAVQPRHDKGAGE